MGRKRQETCKRGHSLTDLENVYEWTDPLLNETRRRCKKCQNMVNKRSRRKRLLKALAAKGLCKRHKNPINDCLECKTLKYELTIKWERRHIELFS